MKQLPQIMYDQSQFTSVYFIDRRGGWLSDEMYVGMKRIAGYAPSPWYLYTQLLPESFFFGAYNTRALELESRSGFNNFTNKRWVKKFEQDVEAMYVKTKRLVDIYFRKFYRREAEAVVSGRESVALFLDDIRKLMAFVMAHYIVTQPQQFYAFEKLLGDQTDERVRALMNNARRLTRVLGLRKFVLEYAEWVIKSGLSVASFNKKHPQDFRLTVKRINESGFLTWGLLGGNLVNAGYLVKEIDRLRRKPAKLDEELRQIREVEKRIRERNAIARRYKANKLFAAADIVGHSALLRFDMQTYSLCLMKYLKRFVDALQKVYGLKTDDVSAYEYDELIQLLRSGTRVPARTLEERKRGYLRIFTNKNIATLAGENARNTIKEILKARKEAHAHVKPLHGTIASRPHGERRVTGTAFVMTTAFSAERDIKNFRKGHILVATQTHPDLMPAIRKALAIVTDEGGLTSHAAIMSRELGIPALIGARLATKLFKTGDTLILDFDKGVVKKS